jgi:serine/threonine protein kinase
VSLPSQEDIFLAARLAHHEIVSREVMQECLGACDGDPPRSIAAVLLDRGILTRGELEAYSGKSPEELQPIPNYRIDGPIGEGGMATIYRATYLPIDREIALKIMHPELAHVERNRMRFFREAGILRHLDHPNIVKVYEDGHVGPWHFFAMKYVPGVSLLEKIEKGGPLSENQAMKVVAQIADAMEMMLSRGVLHRDIKPGNIIVTDRFDAHIIDLGLAKLVAGMRDDGSEGMTVGTVEYISPEQARGQRVDVRSDIYSLGVTLYHSVVGEVPFSGSDGMEIMAKQILSSLKGPRLRGLGPFTRFLIEKMMAKDAKHRYQRPAELVEAIRGHAPDLEAKVDAEVGGGGRPKILRSGRQESRRRAAARGRRRVSRRRRRK